MVYYLNDKQRDALSRPDTVTDLMFDGETTGLRPDRHGLIQISILPFNLNHGCIWPDYAFNQCMYPLPNREWSLSTYNWWNDPKQIDVYRSIVARSQPAAQVLYGLNEWLKPVLPTVSRIWGLRPFDWQFLDSHFADVGLKNPMKYYFFREVATAAEVWAGDHDRAQELRPKKVDGHAHDALNDCVMQAEWLMKCRNGGLGHGHSLAQ